MPVSRPTGWGTPLPSHPAAMSTKQERFALFHKHCSMHLSASETADVKEALGAFIKDPDPRELVRKLNGVLSSPPKRVIFSTISLMIPPALREEYLRLAGMGPRKTFAVSSRNEMNQPNAQDIAQIRAKVQVRAQSIRQGKLATTASTTPAHLPTAIPPVTGGEMPRGATGALSSLITCFGDAVLGAALPELAWLPGR